jgi:hypothetical protein
MQHNYRVVDGDFVHSILLSFVTMQHDQTMQTASTRRRGVMMHRAELEMRGEDTPARNRGWCEKSCANEERPRFTEVRLPLKE